MSVSINGNSIDVRNIISFDIDESNNVHLPEWLNNNADINDNFWNKNTYKISYVIRLNDADKWIFETILLNHAFVNLTDTIYGINDNVYITSISSSISFVNISKLWVSTITIIGNV